MHMPVPAKTRRRFLRPLELVRELPDGMLHLCHEHWPRRSLAWAPTIDMFDRGNHLVVKTELPGLKKEEVEVLMEEGDLVIKGERKQEKEVNEDDYYRIEQGSGAFYRRIALPFDVDVKNVSARFENGVLEVEILRPPEERKHTEEIPVH